MLVRTEEKNEEDQERKKVQERVLEFHHIRPPLLHLP